MLVADECHRAGANEMSKVLKTKCRWSLGLSATPEREDDDDAGYDKSLLGKKTRANRLRIHAGRRSARGFSSEVHNQPLRLAA